MPAISRENSLEFWGALAIAIGAVGVLITSAFYALSPAVAALPTADLAMPGAFQAAAGALSTMWSAGTVGIVSDVVLAAGALTLVTVDRQAGSGLRQLGWAAAAISAIVFIVVDTLAGHVLPQLASLAGGEIAFVGFKRLFDALFVLGTLAFGGATVLIFLGQIRDGAAIFGIIGTVVGVLGVILGLGHFAGLKVGQPIGLFVALGSILFVILAIRILRRAPAGSRTANASG